MTKSFFLLAAMIAVAMQGLRAQAPIPNGDFEQWSNGNPVGWSTDNNGQYAPITQTSDAHGGSFALKGAVLGVAGIATFPPIMYSGTSPSNPGFPYTDHPNSFTGYYKFSPTGSDSMIILCVFTKNGNGVGAASFGSSANVSSYTSFAVPIQWISNDAPDSVEFTLEIYSSSGATHMGSTMFLDDLAFSNQVVGGDAVNPLPTLTFSLDQNYPNPLLNTSTTLINYSLPESGYTTLTIYDMDGRSIAVPLRGFESSGKHLVQFDVSTLPVGTYTYRLVENDHSLSRIMQILH